MIARHTMRLAAALALLAIASGCASREQTIRNHLVQAGLSESMARCMADPLARNLTNDQLRKLARLAGTVRADPRQMTYGDALRALESVGDPQLLQISVRTATGCALRP